MKQHSIQHWYPISGSNEACTPSENELSTWTVSADGKFSVDDKGSPANITSGDITSYDCTTLVITSKDPTATEETKYRLSLKK